MALTQRKRGTTHPTGKRELIIPPVFAHLLKDAGLPMPAMEYRFAPPRRWRFDYAWLDYRHLSDDVRVALEVDGGVWTRGRHVRGKGFINDQDKRNEAVRLGWRVIHRTPDTLCTDATIQLLKDLIHD